MKGKIFFWCIICCFYVLLGCSETKTNAAVETTTSGVIRISVDESYKPVIEEQLKVFRASYPNAVILVKYAPEAVCFNDLKQDSTRLIIVSRGLTEKENNYYKETLLFKPAYGILAYDAVAVIVNKEANDSIFTLEKLNRILSGGTNQIAVMDGNVATSTVAFLKESVLKGKSFGKNVVAAQGSQNVIEFVKKRKDILGFVGISWIGDAYDKKQVSALKYIKMARLSCSNCSDSNVFAKPSQSTITYGQYPLRRPLYYILKENASGVGSGFVNFLSLERGQLIFKTSFLAPATMNLYNRRGHIKEKQ